VTKYPHYMQLRAMSVHGMERSCLKVSEPRAVPVPGQLHTQLSVPEAATFDPRTNHYAAEAQAIEERGQGPRELELEP
jgi:hypothetical protein